MKIAIIVRRLNVRGGAQRQALELARFLKEHGHIPKLYTFAYEREACFPELLEGLSVGVLPKAPKKPWHMPYALFENRRARELALRIDPETDVLNPHGEASYKVAYYFKKNRKNAPSVWMMNDMPTKRASFERAREVNPKLRLSIIREFGYHLFDRGERRFITAQDKIMVLDQRDKKWVEKSFGKDADVIRSGADLEKFSFKPHPPLSGKRIKILTTSVFFAHRRFEDTLDALSMLVERGYDPEFTIIGEESTDASYAEKIKKLISEKNLSARVRILGKVSDEALKKAYSEHDVFAFVAHMQSWGIAVFEAMASGLPVVVSSTAGASEVLENRETALIVPPKSPEAIANAVEELAGNPELYQRIQNAGRSFVERNISWKKYGEAMTNVFSTVARPVGKVMLIPVTTNFFSRNFLHTDALRVLAREEHIRLVFLVKPEWKTYYERQFAGENVHFDILPDIRRAPFERLFKFLEVASISTRTSYLQRKTELHRTGSRLPFLFRFAVFSIQRFISFFGKTKLWRRFLRALYARVPSKMCEEVFTRYSPECVFLPTMLNEENVIAREAKKRGIPTVGMLLSWDNFYSKCLLRVFPNRLIVHSDSIKRQAITYGDYPPNAIETIGIPQYDRYFNKTGIKDREQFMRSIGGNPRKKLVVYGISGKQSMDIEMNILEQLSEWVRGREDVELLVRPYPRFDLKDTKLEELKRRYGFLAEGSVRHVTEGPLGWDFDSDSLDFLMNTLAHADVVITMYSTFFIEAAIFDKPIIGIGFDGNLKRNYWNSARRFFDWDHLAEIKALGGIRIVRSREELKTALDHYILHPESDRDGRARIVAQQCGYTDGKSGERLAKVLLAESNR